MTMWRIKRIQFIPVDQQTEECVYSNNAANVTLTDTDTNNEATVKLCWNPETSGCMDDDGLLWLLNGVGYTPADWDAECEFE
jgi:hypothetical protein